MDEKEVESVQNDKIKDGVGTVLQPFPGGRA